MVTAKDFGGDWNLTSMDLKEVTDGKEVEQWIGAALKIWHSGSRSS